MFTTRNVFESQKIVSVNRFAALNCASIQIHQMVEDSDVILNTTKFQNCDPIFRDKVKLKVSFREKVTGKLSHLGRYSQ